MRSFDRLLTAAGRLGSRSGLFIDQFNFFDDTPSSPGIRDSREHSDGRQCSWAAPRCCAAIAPALRSWTDHDYVVNMLYNPGFHRGLAELDGVRRCKIGRRSGRPCCVLRSHHASITQWIDTVESARPHLIPGARGMVVRQRLRAAGGSVAELRLEVLDKTVSLNVPQTRSSARCAEVRLAPALRFAVSAAETAVGVGRVELYIDIQHSRIYSTDGTRGSATPKRFEH